ncbi:hypothetical protein CBA19CS42_30395 [Caballeronia novacaledonica]|uniref:Uncharacterized protein n=1 Tax=Caballeronia novacaledonica TaxID=1544861 RepID=A0AA37MU56_9BURK|nr:hypothetical protein CBA19CS42_30395 [Caballeronia novacaledonica]
MKIVECQQHRPLPRSATPEARNRIEELKARLRCVDRSRDRVIRHFMRAHFRYCRTHDGCVRFGQIFEAARISVTEARAKELSPRPICGRARFFKATSPVHPEIAVRGARHDLLRERRFADAGGAGDKHDATVPFPSLDERCLSQPKIIVSANEKAQPSGHRVHVPVPENHKYAQNSRETSRPRRAVQLPPLMGA